MTESKPAAKKAAAKKAAPPRTDVSPPRSQEVPAAPPIPGDLAVTPRSRIPAVARRAR